MVTLDSRRIVFIAGILSLVAASSHGAEAAIPMRRIRLLQPCLPALIADAAALSPTVRGLIARLDRSDLIVFVRCVPFLNRAVAGRLLFLSAGANHRFVLIEIRIPAQWQVQAAVVAHEMQHAVEVADMPAIRSQAAMAEHYTRNGVAVAGQAEVFDTDAARRTGQQVLRELRMVPGAESARMRESRGDVSSQR